MRGLVLSRIIIACLASVGMLVSSTEAAYNGKSTSCSTPGTPRTCTGTTIRGIEDTSYYAIGGSQATATVTEAFAWVRATNIYHRGTVTWETACQIQNGSSCNTPRSYGCDTEPPPAGCGSNNYTKWYGTTWSWFKPQATEYAIFTGTRSGVDSSYCWNTMLCV